MEAARPDHTAIQCELAARIVREHGCVRFCARGASMLPTIWPGDVLTIGAAPMAAIRNGDVVLVARDSGWCAHRVLSRTATTLITRGDALATTDPPATDAELLGRVISVERHGRELKLRAPTSVSRLLATLLRRFDLLTKLLLHWHSLRRRIAGRSSGNSCSDRNSTFPIPATRI